MILQALHGLSAVGALLHIAGSVLIVVGQTVVKVGHCIEESSSVPLTWRLLPAQPPPLW
jgi:hypothetical protein